MCIRDSLNTIGVPVKKMYVDLLMAMGEDAGRVKEDFQNGRPRGNDKKSTATLDQYSRDLTQMAREGSSRFLSFLCLHSQYQSLNVQ